MTGLCRNDSFYGDQLLFWRLTLQPQFDTEV